MAMLAFGAGLVSSFFLYILIKTTSKSNKEMNFSVPDSVIQPREVSLPTAAQNPISVAPYGCSTPTQPVPNSIPTPTQPSSTPTQLIPNLSTQRAPSSAGTISAAESPHSRRNSEPKNPLTETKGENKHTAKKQITFRTNLLIENGQVSAPRPGTPPKNFPYYPRPGTPPKGCRDCQENSSSRLNWHGSSSVSKSHTTVLKSPTKSNSVSVKSSTNHVNTSKPTTLTLNAAASDASASALSSTTKYFQLLEIQVHFPPKNTKDLSLMADLEI
eukprot:CAMPEP_0114497474 /NCGR_PEP_ID=MMETSP0109-20121206/6347_1 /TAXON_ID=29199 /ORGANISM="Chlorarachnion reptans, Strain CCCM449" /LENGTH=271 /DNA_ID=CAMNT_0001674865 /DNA_START=342 /DNA_END=1158 /DNA_ORIENTATION=-